MLENHTLLFLRLIPLFIYSDLAQAICGWTRPSNPQSVPAMTFLSANEFSEFDDAIGHQFRVLDEVGGS